MKLSIAWVVCTAFQKSGILISERSPKEVEPTFAEYAETVEEVLEECLHKTLSLCLTEGTLWPKVHHGLDSV